MNAKETVSITVQVIVNAPIDTVWKNWTAPDAITKWNKASELWHTPRAENDLRVGGKFLSRMEARDGSFGFDFDGVYDAVVPKEYIEYHISDGRKVKIQFHFDGKEARIVETFEAETEHSIEMQREGWQAILDNFKKYTEESLITTPE